MNGMFKKIYKFITNYFNNKKAEEQFDFEELAEKIPPVFTFSSIVEAMEIFKNFNCCAVPVISLDNEVVGVISERDIAHLIALQSIVGWSELRNLRVDSVYLEKPNLKQKESSLEELAVEFTGKNVEIVPIVNDENKYSGYSVTASRLIAYTSDSIKPRTIGGLATPLGVYLTDGYYSSGSGNLGLILTGVVFSFMIVFVTLLTAYINTFIMLPDVINVVIQLSIFIFILRLSPLAGFHAAEHQTIHAMEKGLELTVENVRSQPKEHDRCGTNLMILVLGFSLMFYVSFDYLSELNWFVHTMILTGFTFIIFSLWRKLGLKLQKFLTTAEPSDDQLMSGIYAGNQLLEFYKTNTRPVKIKPWQKIWNMGLVQILLTFMVISNFIIYIIAHFWPSIFDYATILLTI